MYFDCYAIRLIVGYQTDQKGVLQFIQQHLMGNNAFDEYKEELEEMMETSVVNYQVLEEVLSECREQLHTELTVCASIDRLPIKATEATTFIIGIEVNGGPDEGLDLKTLPDGDYKFTALDADIVGIFARAKQLLCRDDVRLYAGASEYG